MKTYILSTPIDFNFINEDEVEEALSEFGCIALTIDGKVYVSAHNLTTLAQCVFAADLPGAILEVTGIYDSKEEVIEIS